MTNHRCRQVLNGVHATTVARPWKLAASPSSNGRSPSIRVDAGCGGQRQRPGCVASLGIHGATVARGDRTELTLRTTGRRPPGEEGTRHTGFVALLQRGGAGKNGVEPVGHRRSRRPTRLGDCRRRVARRRGPGAGEQLPHQPARRSRMSSALAPSSTYVVAHGDDGDAEVGEVGGSVVVEQHVRRLRRRCGPRPAACAAISAPADLLDAAAPPAASDHGPPTDHRLAGGAAAEAAGRRGRRRPGSRQKS